MDKAAKFFVYLSLASPLLFNRQLFFPFITGKALFFRTAIELALFCFVIFLTTNTEEAKNMLKKIKHPLFAAIAGFALIFVFSSLTALNKTTAFWSNFERAEGGWQILHYFFFFILLCLLFKGKKEWVNLIRWQTLVGMGVTLYGLGQYLNIWPGFFINVGNPTGTLGNPSYVSIYLIFVIFFAIWLIKEEHTWLKWLWLAIIPFELFVIYESQTRAADLAIGIGIALIFILLAIQFHQRHKERFSKKFLTLCYLTTILVATIVAITSAYIAFNFGQFDSAIDSLRPRFWTWSTSLAGFFEKPLLGWGPENFPYIFDKYYNANHFGIESWFDRAHNVFLQYLVDGGIVLLMAYLGMFFFFYKKLWQLPREWFWTLIFGLPVIYLINGLALFEVLPIYLNLFLFFAFFINYANNFHSPVTPQRKQQTIAPVGWLSIYSSAFFIAASLYLTIYLPLQKNRLIIQAVKTNNKTAEEVFDNFSKAISFYSPIGQSETDHQLFSFTIDFFEWLKAKDPLTDEVKADIDPVVKLTEEVFHKNRERYIGVKNTYLLLLIYIKAHEITANKELLERARLLVEKEIVLAPTRIELLNQQLKIAELEKNEAEFNLISRKIKQIRPDL